MLNFTPLVKPYFNRLVALSASWATPEGVEKVQRNVLRNLLHRAANTEIGRSYGFDSRMTAEDFISALPLVEYEDIRPQVMRMLAGEENVLWPGATTRFAQSSGTSGGKSKFIPITPEGLKTNHYAGASFPVAFYLHNNPHSRLFAGKSFILGGSFANELDGLPRGVKVGDLSANLIECINPLANLVRVPDKEIALMEDWNKKLPALVKAAAKENITNISGVPSWFLTVLQRIMAEKGASSIHSVWPNLEVFFHGGIAFEPYRSQYEAITDPSKMHWLENYNASEGFFATQDVLEAKGMRLLPDVGVFFEFVALDGSRSVTAWEVEQGRTYELVISSCNGLWRYRLGDTVRIESVTPLRISVAGRTKSFINAFGEELMVWNADAAITAACRKTDAAIVNYTAAPVFASGNSKGHHQWLIEWQKMPLGGTEMFAELLDKELQNLNSDYQAKRSGDIFLGRLELLNAKPGLFNSWLAETGKMGGQRKVPRLCNDRRIMDRLIAVNKE